MRRTHWLDSPAMLGFSIGVASVKSSTRQIAHPKFYFFDSGVSRALIGRLPYPATPEERGPLLETWLLQEIRAYLDYRHLHYPVHFWKTRDFLEQLWGDALIV